MQAVLDQRYIENLQDCVPRGPELGTPVHHGTDKQTAVAMETVMVASCECVDMSSQQQIFKYVQSNDFQSVCQLLHSTAEKVENTENVQRKDLFEEKDEAGRSVLITASMLGRSAIVQELVTNGAQVNAPTVRGYTALHLAAGWGHLDTVRTLLALGADTETKTFRGEKPIDLAMKYAKTNCADCLMQASEEEHSNMDNQTNVGL